MELILDFTEAAIEKIKRLLIEQSKSFFRIALQAGGCSGMTYVFSTDDKATTTDHVLSKDDIQILVDFKSGIFLHQSTIDWEESLMRKGFKIINPQQKAGCSCGKSFSV